MWYAVKLGQVSTSEWPGGERIQPGHQLTYLGTTLAANGSVESEVARRLGAAWASFVLLDRLWKHTYLPAKRKLQIFQAVVTPKLLYSFNAVWLSAALRRRVDGFQARCLRRVLRIPASFISRVSNATVLQKAGQVAYSRQLLGAQLEYFGKIAKLADTDPRRALTFAAGTLEPLNNRYIMLYSMQRSSKT